MNSLKRALAFACWVGLFTMGLTLCRAESISASFDAANKLYEQGKFGEAASAYEQLVKSGHASAPIYFNLGNAFFKSGRIGLALLAYRRAERISPRDPDIRANLQFARNQVQGPTIHASWWQRFLRKLTLNEWTALSAFALWLLLLLLAFLQWRPVLKSAVRNYLFFLALVTLLLGGGFGAALQQDRFSRAGIVITREAVIRQGPLDESQPVMTLHDGAEVKITDSKDDWLEVTPDGRRSGWVKHGEIATLAGP